MSNTIRARLESILENDFPDSISKSMPENTCDMSSFASSTSTLCLTVNKTGGSKRELSYIDSSNILLTKRCRNK